MLWCSFLSSGMVGVTRSAGGLGLCASKDINADVEVVQGVLDGAIWWPELKTIAMASDGGHAALFGPISLINAACKLHANVIFKRVLHEYVAITSCAISAGSELLVVYEQSCCDGEVLYCPVCGDACTM
jgi:hypothetical protein